LLVPRLAPEIEELLPPHWRLVRLRFLVPFLSRGNAPVYEENGPLQAVSQQAVRWGRFDADACRGQAAIERPERLKGYLRVGDVLLNSTGAGTLGRATIFPGGEGYIADGHVTVMRTGDDLEPRFLTYVLETSMYQRYIDQGVVVGATKQTELSRDRLQDLAVPVPPIEEQRRIADFLDKECDDIARLQHLKQSLIDRLNEKLVALAGELVLGRHEARAVQPSGLPTVGDVPAHWCVQQNKTVVREVVDLSSDGDEELLTVSHITGVTPRSEKDVNMFLADSFVGYKRCRPGDLVINTMWAWMGALGISHYSGIVSPAYGVYRLDADRMLPAFYDLLYQTPAYISEMTRHSKGIWSSRLRLYPEAFVSLRILIPPLAEQRTIVERYEQVRSPIERLIGELDAGLSVLTARRQALITGAVTGGVDPSSYRSHREAVAA